MDAGIEFAFLLMGAFLSVAGGFLARRFEQRRQARIDISKLIPDIEQAQRNANPDTLEPEVALSLMQLTDRLYRHALLVGILETTEALRIDLLAAEIAKQSLRLVFEDAKAENVELANKIRKLQLEVGESQDPPSDKEPETEDEKAHRREQIAKDLEALRRDLMTFDKRNHDRLMALPMPYALRLWLSKRLRTLMPPWRRGGLR